MENNVSVVVPVYNVDKYLDRCIKSLLSQKMLPKEIILIDDGSTDKSGEMCDAYAEKYDFISAFHKKNEGLGFARNSGIKQVKTDWVIFLDSDDYFNEYLIKDLVDNQKRKNADTVIGGYIKVLNGEEIGKLQYENTEYIGEDVKNTLLPRIIGSSPRKSDSISMGATNVLYSMKIINKFDIRFPSEREYISEDLFFNISYYCHAEHVAIIDKCDYIYATNAGSLSMRYRDDRFEASKKLYYACMKKLTEIGIYDKCQYRLMRSMFNYWRFCIKQEDNRISGHNHKEQVEKIKILCDDSLTKQIIIQYPVKELGFAQKTFLNLIKYKFCDFLLLAVKLGYI